MASFSQITKSLFNILWGQRSVLERTFLAASVLYYLMNWSYFATLLLFIVLWRIWGGRAAALSLVVTVYAYPWLARTAYILDVCHLNPDQTSTYLLRSHNMVNLKVELPDRYVLTYKFGFLVSQKNKRRASASIALAYPSMKAWRCLSKAEKKTQELIAVSLTSDGSVSFDSGHALNAIIESIYNRSITGFGQINYGPPQAGFKRINLRNASKRYSSYYYIYTGEKHPTTIVNFDSCIESAQKCPLSTKTHNHIGVDFTVPPREKDSWLEKATKISQFVAQFHAGYEDEPFQFDPRQLDGVLANVAPNSGDDPVFIFNFPGTYLGSDQLLRTDSDFDGVMDDRIAIQLTLIYPSMAPAFKANGKVVDLHDGEHIFHASIQTRKSGRPISYDTFEAMEQKEGLYAYKDIGKRENLPGKTFIEYFTKPAPKARTDVDRINCKYSGTFSVCEHYLLMDKGYLIKIVGPPELLPHWRQLHKNVRALIASYRLK